MYIWIRWNCCWQWERKVSANYNAVAWDQCFHYTASSVSVNSSLLSPGQGRGNFSPPHTLPHTFPSTMELLDVIGLGRRFTSSPDSTLIEKDLTYVFLSIRKFVCYFLAASVWQLYFTSFLWIIFKILATPSCLFCLAQTHTILADRNIK